MAACGIECAMFSYAVWIGSTVALVVVECFLYSLAMTKCTKQNLFLISQYGTKTKKSKILEQFTEFIQFHSRAKQLSLFSYYKQIARFSHEFIQNSPRTVTNFADIFQHFLMITFAWSLLSISVAMFMVQLEFVE